MLMGRYDIVTETAFAPQIPAPFSGLMPGPSDLQGRTFQTGNQNTFNQILRLTSRLGQLICEIKYNNTDHHSIFRAAFDHCAIMSRFPHEDAPI